MSSAMVVRFPNLLRDSFRSLFHLGTRCGNFEKGMGAEGLQKVMSGHWKRS